MGKFSRDKGKRGELEFAKLCKKHGFESRRGQQYSGTETSADVVGLEGIHIEVKRTEKLNLYDAIDQVKRDKNKSDLGIVAHRRNNHKWLVIMDADEWFNLYLQYFEYLQESKSEEVT